MSARIVDLRNFLDGHAPESGGGDDDGGEEDIAFAVMYHADALMAVAIEMDTANRIALMQTGLLSPEEIDAARVVMRRRCFPELDDEEEGA